jgi:RNA polymerase sigma-70 factor (ECF subfamily)
VRGIHGVRPETSGFPAALTVTIKDDMVALERFYRAHYDAVVRYVTSRITDPYDVADVVADTFLAAVDSAGTFDPHRGQPLPWLIGIAHNKLRRLHRRRHYEHDAAVRTMGRRLLDDDNIAELESRIDAATRGARALGLLDRLSPHQRELIELVDIHGLTPAETAGVFGISTGLARIRLHRARAALRKALDEGDQT